MSTPTCFEENKLYIMTGTGIKWSDFDGPFEQPEDALSTLHKLCGEYASPEMTNSAVLTVFRNNQLHLYKDQYGKPVDGQTVFWNRTPEVTV